MPKSASVLLLSLLFQMSQNQRELAFFQFTFPKVSNRSPELLNRQLSGGFSLAVV